MYRPKGCATPRALMQTVDSGQQGCGFISCNKHTTLVMGEAVHVWRQREYGNLVPSSPFCCEPKTVLKHKSSHFPPKSNKRILKCEKTTCKLDVTCLLRTLQWIPLSLEQKPKSLGWCPRPCSSPAAHPLTHSDLRHIPHTPALGLAIYLEPFLQVSSPLSRLYSMSSR